MIMFFIWLFIVPVNLVIAYYYFPKLEVDWISVALLFGLMCLIMLLPIRFQNVTISLERLVTFTVFFQYGIFAEFVFVQVAIFILLFSDKGKLPLVYRFFVNSTVFAITSVVSGLMFYLMGGNIGTLSFSSLFLVGLAYAITYSFVNNFLLKVYFLFDNRSYSLQSKDAIWDYVTTIMMMSFSLTLYFLHEYIGNQSLLLLVVPFVTVLLIFRMYNSSNTLHDQLSTAGEIGHELSNQLMFDEVLETFLRKLKDVVSFENGYIVDLRSGRKLVPLIGLEDGNITKQVESIVFLKEKHDGDGLSNDYSRIYFNEKEIRILKNIRFLHTVGTVMTAPVIRNGKTEGFLILTTTKEKAFNQINMEIIDVLISYFAISLEKARYFENTLAKSERCGLTKLHNFRYLDRKLDEEIMQLRLGNIQMLSVLILDIDHFKKINDTYGHESGNDLLIKLSEILLKHVSAFETLARYGGEEFVLVLPNCNEAEAAIRAEKIRCEVEGTSFTIIPDLFKERTAINVHMTVSIGVASNVGSKSEGHGLLRNADRALYIGGKQAGRNKVGVYSEHGVTRHKEAQTLI